MNVLNLGVEIPADKLREIEKVVKDDFGWVDIRADGNFYGRGHKGQDGMQYGYIVRDGKTLLIVDCTPDTGDYVVGKVFLDYIKFLEKEG